MSVAARELVREMPVQRRRLIPVEPIQKQTAIKSVKNKKSLKLSFKLALPASLLFVFISLLILNLMGYNEVSIAQRNSRKLAINITSLKAEQDYYQMKLAPYVSPEYVARQANERLGMVIPEEKDLMVLNGDDMEITSPKLAQSPEAAKE